MFLADSHTHSICSPDGRFPMTAMAEGAVRAGLSSLTITDHCDLLSLDGKTRIYEFDWAPVLSEYRAMQEAYGRKLELPLGLEFGMGFIDPPTAERILAQPALDFVIGVVHNLDEAHGGQDFYTLDYEREEDCYRALDNYFDSLIAMTRTDFYHVVGHISYPLRYMCGTYETPISLRRYTDQIRLIFKTAAEKGRGMEVNTWKGQTLSEWVPLLKLFKSCGGEIVTVGSDAHAPEPVGLGIREAYDILRDTGFSYVANYKGRKPEFHKL